MLVKVAAKINARRTVADIVQNLQPEMDASAVFDALYTLKDWGFLPAKNIEPSSVIAWKDPISADLFQTMTALCHPSLASLVSLQTKDDFPLYCFAAIPNRPDGKRGDVGASLFTKGFYTLGSGTTRPQAILTALGEMVETIGARCPINVDFTRATVAGLTGSVIHPHELLQVSDRQYLYSETSSGPFGIGVRIPLPVSPETPLDWVKARTYADKTPYLIPAGFCYLDHTRDRDYILSDSNGLACAPTRNIAIARGFLELVERDAVAIWWYNRIRRPGVELKRYKDAQLNDWIHWLNRQGRHFYVLDLTHDFGIPVMAAISVNIDITDIAMGFGAHFNEGPAVKKAMREMLQLIALKNVMRRQIDTAGIKSLDSAARAFIEWTQSDFVRGQAHMRPKGIRPIVADEEITGAGDTQKELFLIEEKCRARRVLFLVLDFSPSNQIVPVVRVIVPGMRSWRPRFAAGRLYQVPGTMKWRSRPLNEGDLLPFPFPL